MTYRIATEVTITVLDSEDDCDPSDLEQVGTHPVEFNCDSDDPIHVNVAALEALKQDVWVRYPAQFNFEVAYPDGARVECIGRGAAAGD